jgi:N-glycosylase/DNA lyase
LAKTSATGTSLFLSARTIAKLGVEDLAPIRAGFRAKYIIDAATKVVSGEITLENLAVMPLDEARGELMKIKGVGLKVAECTLLYGCGRFDAFPVDVWVKRIMEELYPDGFPACAAGAQGIAQQYLFHWRRQQ